MKTLLKQLLGGAALLYAMSSIVFAQIGCQDIRVGDLPVTLVYPTHETAKTVAMGSFSLDIAINAKPRAGNHRLIVLSHGTAGSSVSDHQLAATLAKAGYIVAQPLHAGDNYKDSSKAGPESWKTRPVEVSQTIDALAKNPLWSPLFDPLKVGVHGMSAGGVTAIALAGGQWNLLTLIRHCGKNLEADIEFCFSGLANDTAAQLKRRAQFKAGALAPEAFLPAELKTLHGAADLRVKAVSLAVPLVAPFTSTSLSSIKTPIGVISAQSDEVLVPAFHSRYLLEQCKYCSTLLDLKNAGHFDLVAPWPADIAKTVAAKQIRGGMPNPAFNAQDREIAFERIASFFNHHLK